MTRKIVGVTVVCALLAATAADAAERRRPKKKKKAAPARQAEEEESDAGPFSKGSVRLSVALGTQRNLSNNDTVIVAGLGAGYYLVDGLEVGLEGQHWFNAEPSVSQFSGNGRFVFFMVPVIKPYVGGFYRHWFVGDGLEDQDSIGARAGLFYVSGRSYFGLGAVYEKTVSACSTDCGVWYPELQLSFSL